MINKSKYNTISKYILSKSNDKWSQEYWTKNKDRYLHLLTLIEQYYTNGKILEIGAFPFHLTLLLKELNYDVTGIDLDPTRHKDIIKENGLNILSLDIEMDNLCLDDLTFELVLFFELFEHLRINPIETLKKINNVINPSGRLLLSTPNLYSIYNIGRFIIGKGFNNAYKEFNKLNTIGHMGHLREYTANEMVQFLSNSGFVNINIHRFSNKTRKNVGIIKSIKNSLTDFICLIFPKLHTHLFIVADKS